MNEKIALVTGASRGLGAAFAQALSNNHHVVAVARTIGALEELDDQITAGGGHASLATLDITQPNSTAQLCRSIFDRWGHVDIWVHAAIHAAPLSPANTIDSRDFSKSLAINVSATANLIQAIAPLLGSDGTAVFFDDQQNRGKFFGAYAATKTAQIELAYSWAAETKKSGPTVRILTPKPMPTALRARFYPGEDRSTLADPRLEANRLIRGLDASIT